VIPQNEWGWFGYPGHFICAADCQFRLCTLVGDHLISTVGDLRFSHERPMGKMQTLGAGEDSFFETYVFKGPFTRCADPECGCNMPKPDDYCEIDGERTATAGAAQEAHMRYCLKYSSPQNEVKSHG
jgi:hypothetical protein